MRKFREDLAREASVMKNVYRYYECDGLCGISIPIPADVASFVLCPNGNKRSGSFILCENCHDWFMATNRDMNLAVESWNIFR
jgi:hypothetical protein